MEPPGFYQRDVANYMKKFDKAIDERNRYKLSMKGKIRFGNKDRNVNVAKSPADND